MGRAAIIGVLAGLLGLQVVRAAGDVPAEAPPPPAQRLPPPEHLTPETRAEIKTRMGRHGETMSNLVRAVVLLDRPTIRTLSSRIADEELVAQNNAANRERQRLMLPPEFFTQQTALGSAARALAGAATEARDDRALADYFAAVTRTCVGCHTVYLHGRPEPLPIGPK
jgi:hypothetical protein